MVAALPGARACAAADIACAWCGRGGGGKPEEALAVLLHLQLECKDMGPNGVAPEPMQQSKLQSKQDGAEHLESAQGDRRKAILMARF